jgi:hypothetical protein
MRRLAMENERIACSDLIDYLVERIVRQAVNFPTPSFLDLGGHLVRAVYALGPMQLRALTVAQGQMEAVRLLEREYESANSRGYHAAVLDARQHPNGCAAVLTELGRILQSQWQNLARLLVADWVTSRCDWNMRCALVELVQIEYGPYLPAEVGAADPDRFADDLFTLLEQVEPLYVSRSTARPTNPAKAGDEFWMVLQQAREILMQHRCR